MDITTLYCDVADHLKEIQSKDIKILTGNLCRNKKRSLCHSEIATILIMFHASNYRNFKYFYKNYILKCHQQDFPSLVSYNRFIEYIPSVIIFTSSFLQSRFDAQTGLAFIDSTTIKVCGNKRISRNKVFKDHAKIAKSSMGWFFGFKLHLVINEKGGLLGVNITAGNVDDRTPVELLTKNLFGKLFGDKGYISQKLFDDLFSRGLKLITSVKKTMKNKLLELTDKILLRKRSIIETVNDQLKNISQIEHTRHRSPKNFLINIICGLIAYTYQEKKPSISGIQRNLAIVD